MISWLFESGPYLEWRTSGGSRSRPRAPEPGHLLSTERAEAPGDRFPEDPLLHYREYLDSWGRKSRVAFIEYGANPGRSAQLVEKSWTRGLPVVLWFPTPPPPGSPHWDQAVAARSIETPSDGRLVWRPMLSWICQGEPEFPREFRRWFREREPIFPPPLVRIEFTERVSIPRAIHLLEELTEPAPPCRLKLFSFAHRHRRKFDASAWKESLLAFEEKSATTPQPERENIIELFTPR